MGQQEKWQPATNVRVVLEGVIQPGPVGANGCDNESLHVSVGRGSGEAQLESLPELGCCIFTEHSEARKLGICDVGQLVHLCSLPRTFLHELNDCCSRRQKRPETRTGHLLIKLSECFRAASKPSLKSFLKCIYPGLSNPPRIST